MHYDEDDEEYSDLDLDFEDAVERGYEDDKDRDDDRFKWSGLGKFSNRSGSGTPSTGTGCAVMLGFMGVSLVTLWGGWLFWV